MWCNCVVLKNFATSLNTIVQHPSTQPLISSDSVPAQIWDQIKTSTEPLGTAPTLLIALAVGVLVVLNPTWQILRNVITIAHEGAHAFVALLVGRKLQSIKLHSDTSGLTVSRGKPRGFGMILTAFAGYVGPALVGLLGAWVVSHGFTLGWVWAFVVVLVLMLFKVRNLFGAWVLALTGAILGCAAWFAPDSVRVYVAYALVWLFLLGAPKAVFELIRTVRTKRTGTSDAEMLGKLSWFPAGFWLFTFVLVTVGCLILGLWLLVPELFNLLA